MVLAGDLTRLVVGGRHAGRSDRNGHWPPRCLLRWQDTKKPAIQRRRARCASIDRRCHCSVGFRSFCVLCPCSAGDKNRSISRAAPGIAGHLPVSRLPRGRIPNQLAFAASDFHKHSRPLTFPLAFSFDQSDESSWAKQMQKSIASRQILNAYGFDVNNDGTLQTRLEAIKKMGSGSGYSFFFSVESFSRMKVRISSAMANSFSHCSRYSVTGKRPIP